MGGSHVVSWRHFLQAKNKLKTDRSVGTGWTECRGGAVSKHEGKHLFLVHLDGRAHLQQRGSPRLLRAFRKTDTC